MSIWGYFGCAGWGWVWRAGRSEFFLRAGRSGAETEERGVEKPRGRGLGQRNINFLPVDNKEICIYVNMYLCMTMLTINIPEEMHQTIKMDALKENKSIKDYILSSISFKKAAEERELMKKYSKTMKKYDAVFAKLKDL